MTDEEKVVPMRLGTMRTLLASCPEEMSLCEWAMATCVVATCVCGHDNLGHSMSKYGNRNCYHTGCECRSFRPHKRSEVLDDRSKSDYRGGLIESVIDDLDRLKPVFNYPIPPSGRKSYGGET